MSGQANFLRRNEQSLLSEKEVKTLRRELAELFFNDWQNELASLQSSFSKELFCRYVIGETDLGVPLIEDMPSFMHELKAKEQTKELYGKISILRQYLKETIKTTLSNSGDVNYGRAEDGSNTIPYKGNNVPSEAEFGEEFERIGYFIQDYIQKGLSHQQVLSWVHQLLVKISSEMQQGMADKGAITSFKETSTYQRFHQDFPAIDLTKINQDPALIKEFLTQLNKNEESKLHFLQTWIFPSLECPINKSVRMLKISSICSIASVVLQETLECRYISPQN